MNDGATVIGEDLKLDVVRVLDEFLNVNAGVAEGLFSFADYPINTQVALAAGSFADTNGLVGQLHVHRICVNLGIDRYGADVQLLAGANDADGDFAPVRYQNLLKHLAIEYYKTAEPR